jgi:iron complex outermembrane receptor protein
MELSSSWKASSRWDLRAGYALTRMRVTDADNDSYAAELGSPPTQQFQLRSMLTLTSRLELDTTAYYVSRLSKQDVPAYTRLDVRLGWHVSPACELSIVGQNLLAPQHLEFNGVQQGTSTVPVKRSVYGKVTWRF